MGSWPAPVRAVRAWLPAEMRLLRGVGSLAGAVAILIGFFGVLFGGNWRLGYGDTRVLAGLFLLLVSAGVGAVAPLWYWVGRPVWAHVGRPGLRWIRQVEEARFLPGLAASVAGIWLPAPVTATSGIWLQALVPLGVAVGVSGPLWFWVGRPLVGHRIAGWLPGRLPDRPVLTAARRAVPVVVVLAVASLAVTAVIGLPLVALGTPVEGDGLTVTVTDARTTATATADGESLAGRDVWRIALVRIAVTNTGDTPQEVPGATFGDVTLLAPACTAQNFGEPAHNCNEAFVDGPITADGTTYPSYEARREAANGTVAPGEEVTGWLAFFVEQRSPDQPGFEAVVIVDDVGRWRLGAGWPSGQTRL